MAERCPGNGKCEQTKWFCLGAGADSFFVCDEVDEAPAVEPDGEEAVPPITADAMVTVLDETMVTAA